MSNVLDLLDQTTFDVGRATGANSLMQSVWTYDRPIDTGGLQRFHANLQRGRLSRCIEKSPLPFGRHRWVGPRRSSDIEVASARPRDEFADWLDERANAPLDCEHGPGWRLAVLPFTDGGTGVSLVVPHCLVDGVGLWQALADAAAGRDDPVRWPAAESRRRWQAVREDIRQCARDIPAVGRAIAAAARLGRRSRKGGGIGTPLTAKSQILPPGAEAAIALPMATVFVDAGEWETCAKSLGGTTNALLVGLAARLAQRVGRTGADGSVIVMMPVSERTPDDTRANAIGNVGVTVDPAQAATDLDDIRTAIKQALIRHREASEDEYAVNALVPLLPKRILRAAGMANSVAAPNLVGASNVGTIGAAAGRADGTDADSFALRILHMGVTMTMLERFGGVQSFLSGTSHGKVFVSAVSYRPGRTNSDRVLQQDLSTALSDFSLTGTFL